MASTAIGKLDEFDPINDSITAYVERANLYFQANGIEEGKHCFLERHRGKNLLFIKKFDSPDAAKGQILSPDSEKAL